MKLNMIDKYILIVLIVLLMPFKSLANSLTVGVIEYPPHIDFKNNIKSEKAYKYVHAVLERKFSDIKYIKYPTKRALAELKKGNIDLLYPIDDPTNQLNLLTNAFFYSTPGLCFKKKNFIPILSATHLLKKLAIGVPSGTKLVPTLANSQANLIDIKGADSLNRGVELLRLGRLDALFHPNPIKIYNETNPLSKEIACSYFHGYSSEVHIAIKPNMDKKIFKIIDDAFTIAQNETSYEYFFTQK